MTDTLLTILGSVGLTILWNTSEPASWLRMRLGWHTCSKSRVRSFLARLSECATCSGWWVGLAAGLLASLGWWSIAHGAAVSVLAELVWRRLQKIC